MSGLAHGKLEAGGPDWAATAATAAAPPASPPCPPSDGLLACILPGMVGRGYGLETLCLYLAVARTALLDLIVVLGLPTPHDRAHRRAGGRNPWSPDDIPAFIELWMAGWYASSLGERFGRSPCGIWSKARQLGLPRRDRKALFRPGDPNSPTSRETMLGPVASNFPLAVRAMPQAATNASQNSSRRLTASASGGVTENLNTGSQNISSPKTSPPVCGASAKTDPTTHASPFQASLPVVLAGRVTSRPGKPAAPRGPRASSVFSAAAIPTSPFLAFDPPLPAMPGPFAVPLPVPGLRRKGLRKEIIWTTGLDEEIAQRHWAFQHYKAAARDMGMSPGAMRSRKTRLELGQLPRGETVDEFNPAWAADTIAAYDYVKKRCKAFWDLRGIEFFFWSRRSEGRRFSELARSKAWFRDLACA